MIRGLIPHRLLFRQTTRSLAERGLEFLGVDAADPELLDLVSAGLSPLDLPEEEKLALPGECLYRNLAGRIGLMKVLIPMDPVVMRVIHTTPATTGPQHDHDPGLADVAADAGVRAAAPGAAVRCARRHRCTLLTSLPVHADPSPKTPPSVPEAGAQRTTTGRGRGDRGGHARAGRKALHGGAGGNARRGEGTAAQVARRRGWRPRRFRRHRLQWPADQRLHRQVGYRRSDGLGPGYPELAHRAVLHGHQVADRVLLLAHRLVAVLRPGQAAARPCVVGRPPCSAPWARCLPPSSHWRCSSSSSRRSSTPCRKTGAGN
ncbi:ATP-binding protein [Streptomyces yanii]|uniref:ATP-binding protein n=1 Tax=Streptomyces yanii TaxID=78510 RepID=UPI003CD071F8